MDLIDGGVQDTGQGQNLSYSNERTLDSTAEENDRNLEKMLQAAHQALKQTERKLEKSQSYNEELRKQIEILSQELHVYRSAAQNRKDVEVQVNEVNFLDAICDKPFPNWGTGDDSNQILKENEESSGVGVSIAESLKAAAEEEVWKRAGFVYDSTSGHYYDYNSGYYYDSARSLYYDPSTTSYFYYDEAEQTYKFHSYAYDNSQNNQQSAGEGNKIDVDASSNCPTAKQGTHSLHTTKNRKSHHKHKERPKVKSCKINKVKRRTKSSKHKRPRKKLGGSNTGEDKMSKTGPQGVLIKTEEAVAVVVIDSDSDEQTNTNGNNDSKTETVHAPSDKEMLDFDDSSDSLATGESEMESEPESGELTDQSTASVDEAEDEDMAVAELSADPVVYDTSQGIVAQPEVSQSYPPCIRAIVRSSDVVDIGTFFLVTCQGGTIGRDKDPQHAIQIQDVNISKVHADIRYDMDNNCFTVKDCGSQNGTYLNDLRISESKEKSEHIPLSHGDIVKVASTEILIHIHPGSETCDDCEPGQVLACLRAQQATVNDHVILTKEEKKKHARQQMKSLKQKYGLVNAAYADNMEAIKNPDYADRAYLRRKYVGSEDPSHLKRDEKPASVHKPISTENRGHQMLAKMGWKEGSGLGKDNAGIAEPVSVDFRVNQTAGLGSQANVGLSLDSVHSARKAQQISKTRERFERLQSYNSQKVKGDRSLCHPHNIGSLSSPAECLQLSSRESLQQARTPVQASINSPSSKFQMQWVRGEVQKPS